MNHITQNTAQTIATALRPDTRPMSDEISVVHWLRPWEHTPDEASYVLIKQDLGADGVFCMEGSFETGRFWDMVPGSAPLDEKTVQGWSYLPFDDRLAPM